MKIDILTLFPEMVNCVMHTSVIGRAQQAGLIEINAVNSSRALFWQNGAPCALIRTVWTCVPPVTCSWQRYSGSACMTIPLPPP